MIETLMLLMLAFAFACASVCIICIAWCLIKAIYSAFHVELKLKRFWKKITTERMDW